MTERVSQDREDGVWMVIPDLRGKGMQVTHTHTGIAALISKLGKSHYFIQFFVRTHTPLT